MESCGEKQHVTLTHNQFVTPGKLAKLSLPLVLTRDMNNLYRIP